MLRFTKSYLCSRFSSNFNQTLWRVETVVIRGEYGLLPFGDLPNFKNLPHFENNFLSYLAISQNLSWFHLAKGQAGRQGPMLLGFCAWKGYRFVSNSSSIFCPGYRVVYLDKSTSMFISKCIIGYMYLKHHNLTNMIQSGATHRCYNLNLLQSQLIV